MDKATNLNERAHKDEREKSGDDAKRIKREAEGGATSQQRGLHDDAMQGIEHNTEQDRGVEETSQAPGTETQLPTAPRSQDTAGSS